MKTWGRLQNTNSSWNLQPEWPQIASTNLVTGDEVENIIWISPLPHTTTTITGAYHSWGFSWISQSLEHSHNRHIETAPQKQQGWEKACSTTINLTLQFSAIKEDSKLITEKDIGQKLDLDFCMWSVLILKEHCPQMQTVNKHAGSCTATWGQSSANNKHQNLQGVISAYLIFPCCWHRKPSSKIRNKLRAK